MRFRIAVILLLSVLIVVFAIWAGKRAAPATPSNSTPPAAKKQPTVFVQPQQSGTNIYAHNLRLHQGPNFSVYVRWLRGEMVPTRKNVNVSFDDLESFYMGITNGVLRANLGDISHFLNSSPDSPLKKIEVRGDGNTLTIKGTLHKIIPLPIQLTGVISAEPNSRIRMHVTKIEVLKLPVKWLLKDFHIKLSDLFHAKQIPGIEVSQNDIVFDSQTLLPAPHIRGTLSSVMVQNPDLQANYGDAREDVARTEEWRNFLRLKGGAINFGKLTMSPVDLIMIDTSQDSWFDLDLSRYQEQLVNGYTRMTPAAGLQIFMPDISSIPVNKASKNISIEWLKDRNVQPPADVTKK